VNQRPFYYLHIEAYFNDSHNEGNNVFSPVRIQHAHTFFVVAPSSIVMCIIFNSAYLFIKCPKVEGLFVKPHIGMING